MGDNKGKLETTGSIGVVIALGSWVILFCTLLYAYWILRVQVPDREPVALGKAFWLALLNTLVLAGSSWCLIKAVRQKKINEARPAVMQALGLGFVFFIMQGLLWVLLLRQGVGFYTDNLATMFYLITGFHALHLLGGLGLMLWLLQRMKTDAVAVRVVMRRTGWYWHVLCGAWILVCVSIFVV